MGVPPEQVQPITGPEQSPSHLSADDISPSSQISPTLFRPSPQIGVQTDGIVVLTQRKPVSI